jgi:hypothetical protein
MYKKGAEPWEYPNEYLVTLCESCHEDESKILERCVNEFIEIIRCKFFAVDISELSTAFRYIESGHSSLCLAESIKHFLLEPANIEKIEEDYIKYREIAFKPNTLFGDLPLNP